MNLQDPTQDDKINDLIQIILRQTNFSEIEAREKLTENNGDHLKVIKIYFGITEKKELPVKSINQEIYKQFRVKLQNNLNT